MRNPRSRYAAAWVTDDTVLPMYSCPCMHMKCDECAKSHSGQGELINLRVGTHTKQNKQTKKHTHTHKTNKKVMFLPCIFSSSESGIVYLAVIQQIVLTMSNEIKFSRFHSMELFLTAVTIATKEEAWKHMAWKDEKGSTFIKGPDLLSASVVRFDQLLTEISGADQRNHFTDRFHWSAPPVSRSNWSVRTTESESGSGF